MRGTAQFAVLYGFSGKPTSPGWDPDRIARAWVVLMKRLGYKTFIFNLSSSFGVQSEMHHQAIMTA
jgi:hypothetical protein